MQSPEHRGSLMFGRLWGARLLAFAKPASLHIGRVAKVRFIREKDFNRVLLLSLGDSLDELCHSRFFYLNVSKKYFGLDSTSHKMDHRHVDHRLTARREVFVVFAQPALFSKAAAGSLNNPSFGQQHEAFGLIGTLDHFQLLDSTFIFGYFF